jgi:3-phenylpropionate/cinnamic acid dioxygenase small subunit
MDDVDLSRNRTADITYDDYETNNGIAFATNRQIVATEKNKIDIRMNFKQYEFNKELSVSMTVPKNYQRK